MLTRTMGLGDIRSQEWQILRFAILNDTKEP